ncbi:MAG: preprotein translocase subunit SecE [Acidobacteria bacterium]|nr:preprotein translocase subunit SecE [Acidobacteriota bacterium]MXW02715.1 preprotein translocase subunit SecE [Holophagales bacterium]MXX60013.1 preprotein translocase subunit SecE [Holophagales bacterium]MXZ38787.1 preprotein translocase subunit SecE [Holophagales bacterium]MYA06985.1 preprotein translocase subunit SecE [Holophagales bacterium]
MASVRRLGAFLGEVRTEMKKVTFPSREEVVGTTGVVLITSVIFAIFLWVADVVILRLYNGLNNLLLGQ